jgi:cation transport ATPase
MAALDLNEHLVSKAIVEAAEARLNDRLPVARGALRMEPGVGLEAEGLRIGTPK